MLAESLRLPEATRRDAMTRFYERFCGHDVFDWARETLTSRRFSNRRHSARPRLMRSRHGRTSRS